MAPALLQEPAFALETLAGERLQPITPMAESQVKASYPTYANAAKKATFTLLNLGAVVA